jgi:thiamine biosynthesis lipoprotein
MVASSLEKQGITGFVLNVGGNVRTIGTKADGAPWKAGINNPEESEETPYVAYLSLSGESLVTSGSYQRYYTVDGKKYHHIIDAKTLMPAEGFLSVSVVCGSSADGDALSTALFCMSVEEGMQLVQSLDGVEALWILPDGTQIASDGFADYLAQE